jgi:hypothetical protein
VATGLAGELDEIAPVPPTAVVGGLAALVTVGVAVVLGAAADPLAGPTAVGVPELAVEAGAGVISAAAAAACAASWLMNPAGSGA